MKTALFTNFTSTSFTGRWNGKSYVFLSGDKKWMADYLARHFAKHLVNQELLSQGLERSTSPKRPEDVPEFMDLFNKAYTPAEDEEMTTVEDPVESQMNTLNKNREKPAKQNSSEPQIVESPDDDEDDSEESFGGAPVEITATETKTKQSKA